LDFFAATSSSKGIGDNGGVIGMSSSFMHKENLIFLGQSLSFIQKYEDCPK
jgi:hypothetical protein